MKFPVLLTTDLRHLAYFVTFRKRTKKMQSFLRVSWECVRAATLLSHSVPLACPLSGLGNALRSRRVVVITVLAPFPPFVVFAHALINALRIAFLYLK